MTKWTKISLVVAAAVFSTVLACRSQPASDPTATPGASLQAPEMVVQSGHSGPVTAVAFSAKGRWLASGSADSTVKIWEVSSGRELRTFAGHGREVSSVAFSPDASLVASASALEGAMRVWGTVSGQQVWSLETHQSSVLSSKVSFSATGKWIAYSTDNATYLADAASGRVTRTFTDEINAAFSPDGVLLATASGGSVRIREVESGAEVFTFQSGIDAINDLEFRSEGGVLAVAGGIRAPSREVTAGRIVLWDLVHRTVTATLIGHTKLVTAVTFSPAGDLVASAAWDGTIRYWDPSTGAETLKIDNPGGQVADLTCGPRWLATANQDRTITLWAREPRTIGEGIGSVYSVQFSGDGRWLALGSDDGTVKQWEIATGRQVRGFHVPGRGIADFQLSADGSMAALVPIDWPMFATWDMVHGKLAQAYKGHSANVQRVAFSADGRRIASSSLDHTLRIWESKTGSALQTIKTDDPSADASALEDPPGSVIDLTFSHDGRLVATADQSHQIKLWDSATGRMVRKIPTFDTVDIEFSPDDKMLAGGADHQVNIWDVETGEVARELTGHQRPVSAVAFSPDGRVIASSGEDDTVRLWDTATGAPIRTLTGHTSTVRGLAFSPDGRLILSGSADGTTRLWESDTGTWLATLISPRDLAEWLVVTPDGLFDGAPATWNKLLWRFSNNTFDIAPVETFFNEYFYPGLLAEILGGKRPHAARNIGNLDRRQPVLEIKILNAPADNSPIAARTVTVRVSVEEAPADSAHRAGSGARDIRLFRNGSLVKTWRGDVLAGKSQKMVLDATVVLTAGSNILTAYGFNSDNVKSVDATATVMGANLGRAGVAYVVAIGIDRYANPEYSLKYAVADATAFSQQLSDAQSQLGFEKVVTVLLLDADATKANILGAITRLAGGRAASPEPGELPSVASLAAAQPEDAVFLYYAGHGTAAGSRFYLIPHDLGYAGPRRGLDQVGLETILAHGISDEDLERAFESVDARALLLVIDACNSGQALEAEEKRRGPMNSRGLAQLAYEKGMYILTGAQSYQAALEAAQLGHGYLTYALVEEGLRNGEADRSPADKQILASEWLQYSTERVPQMQEGRMQEGRALFHEIAFVEGDERIPDIAKRSLQRPRLFHRPEAESSRFVIANLQRAAGK